MVTSHDKSSTITIGNLDAGDSLATVNNLISSGGHQTGSSSGHQTGSNNESSAKEQNQLFNGFGIVERNVVYIFEQLNFIIRSRFQTSTTLFAPSICFLLIFVYVLNLFTSPRASTIEPDKISDDFRKTESVISSTLTLVPGESDEIRTEFRLEFQACSRLCCLPPIFAYLQCLTHLSTTSHLPPLAPFDRKHSGAQLLAMVGHQLPDLSIRRVSLVLGDQRYRGCYVVHQSDRAVVRTKGAGDVLLRGEHIRRLLHSHPLHYAVLALWRRSLPV